MKPIAAVVICAAMFSTQAQAFFPGRHYQPCDNPPPLSARQAVTVPVSITTIPGSKMFWACHKQPADLVIYGCTFLPAPDRQARILINADEDEIERACTLLYENAHLPPNNWLDEATEAATLDARPGPLDRLSAPAGPAVAQTASSGGVR